MVKETGRKCSYCGQSGHNSRTCNGKVVGVKLFGVNISAMEKHENLMNRSFSMGNLHSYAENNNNVGGVFHDGYLSDEQIHYKKQKTAAHERKRGKSWTDEEHRIFLESLKKLGKGDWRGISKNFVTTRTPTQVASHAQKYFLRHSGNNKKKKKRRASLFDMALVHESQSKKNASLQCSFSEEITRNSSQIVNKFPNLRLDDRPIPVPVPGVSLTSYPSFPTFCHKIQPMEGAPNGLGFHETQMIQSLPLLHSINYAGPRYVYMTKLLGSVGVPAAHPSGIPCPSSGQHSMFRAGPSKEKDLLELKIGPPQSSKNTRLRSQAFISVI